ncbi:hypothetical protein PR202_gb19814 [Eleusine coracana subsp. coracana]|uniref:Ribosomal L1 domain-containing protein 1 n=1 Tax=Eleusine coracana subsp. coracana TaxID=191504 RepID=A0AAV5F9S7_ELECO|nr:hypothetical protein QOZ80_3BG0280650 [Eleusine coracana subsp. coracana]GJN31418.1 hypothetical protein PR202_gb19814 [Eleusine coracana subsp. coracana]
MSPPPQQPHPVPRATVASAVGALTKWMKKRAAEAPPSLLADERDDLVVLQLSLRRVPASSKIKPHLLPLPHSVVGHSGASVCIVSDDRPKSRSPSASDLLDKSKSLQLPVSEVIPLSTLRTDYRPYESRRRLAVSHDLFIADRAILPLLPRVLGKAFYSTKKAPIGVDFTRVGWPDQMRKVLGSSFLYLRTGTCSGIKVGRLDMEEEEIVENVIAAIDAAVEKVPKKWANVRALHLKAVDSVSLPIYQAVPELGMKIEVPPVALLEGQVGTAEVNDTAEVPKISNKKMSVDADDGEDLDKEKSGKRKRTKKKQTEDVVMQEAEPEEKKRKSNLVPTGEGQKVGKKGKRALEKEAEASKDNKKGRKSGPALEEVNNTKKKGKKEDTKHELGEAEASKDNKKGRKSEPALEEVNNTKKKGKMEDTKHALGDDVVAEAEANIKKGKSKEGKKKKSSKGRADDCVESPEDKKSKVKKSDGDKIKKTRTRVKV